MKGAYEEREAHSPLVEGEVSSSERRALDTSMGSGRKPEAGSSNKDSGKAVRAELQKYFEGKKLNISGGSDGQLSRLKRRFEGTATEEQMAAYARESKSVTREKVGPLPGRMSRERHDEIVKRAFGKDADIIEGWKDLEKGGSSSKIDPGAYARTVRAAMGDDFEKTNQAESIARRFGVRVEELGLEKAEPDYGSYIDSLQRENADKGLSEAQVSKLETIAKQFGIAENGYPEKAELDYSRYAELIRKEHENKGLDEAETLESKAARSAIRREISSLIGPKEVRGSEAEPTADPLPGFLREEKRRRESRGIGAEDKKTPAEERALVGRLEKEDGQPIDSRSGNFGRALSYWFGPKAAALAGESWNKVLIGVMELGASGHLKKISEYRGKLKEAEKKLGDLPKWRFFARAWQRSKVNSLTKKIGREQNKVSKWESRKAPYIERLEQIADHMQQTIEVNLRPLREKLESGERELGHLRATVEAYRKNRNITAETLQGLREQKRVLPYGKRAEINSRIKVAEESLKECSRELKKIEKTTVVRQKTLSQLKARTEPWQSRWDSYKELKNQAEKYKEPVDPEELGADILGMRQKIEGAGKAEGEGRGSESVETRSEGAPKTWLDYVELWNRYNGAEAGYRLDEAFFEGMKVKKDLEIKPEEFYRALEEYFDAQMAASVAPAKRIDERQRDQLGDTLEYFKRIVGQESNS